MQQLVGRKRKHDDGDVQQRMRKFLQDFAAIPVSPSAPDAALQQARTLYQQLVSEAKENSALKGALQAALGEQMAAA